MNLYKKMYVVSEDEYRRLTESMQLTVSQCPTSHLDIDHNNIMPIESEIVNDDDKIVDDIDQTNNKKDKEKEKKERKNKKKHKCNQCEKEYSDKHDLRRHKKKIHAKQDTDIKPQEGEDIGIVIKKKINQQQRDPFRQKITKWRTMMMM